MPLTLSQIIRIQFYTLGIHPNNNPQDNPFKLGDSSLSIVEQFFQQDRQNNQRNAGGNHNNSSLPSNNILNLRQTDGNFSLNRAQLEGIYGDTLPDGQHTLQLMAVDLFGNRSGLDVGFVLDTSLPQLSLNSPAFDVPLTETSRLTGTVRDTGARIVSLDYRFDDLPTISLDRAGDSFDGAIDYSGVANGDRQLTDLARVTNILVIGTMILEVDDLVERLKGRCD